jgi:hypothetical protein
MRIQNCRIFQRLDIFNIWKDNPERLEIAIVGKKEELNNLIKIINMECAK